jgi:hypothetical protein
MAEIVSGVGADSKRTDNNISSRVSKIQREAKIQNATGGTYGQAGELTALAQGASTNVPLPTQTSMPTPAVNRNPGPPIDVFAQGNPNVPDTDGAPGLTPGRQPSELTPMVQGPNELSVLARAIYASNPTPMWRRIVESFDEEGV